MVRAIICGSVIVTMTELKIKIPEDLKRKMEKFGVDWSTPSDTEQHLCFLSIQSIHKSYVHLCPHKYT
ncbi:MAG: hypothetical protein ACUVXA_19430 [Candidatus Jordarchaeum sp.]|uniref:hypothetical protein n=1 Tax=Candidatus Jordarchaeum sp. TaxID=2823881 RepID=UPI00404B06E1